MADVFAVQIFFIVFRECLEASIIISVLLSFLKQVLGQPDQDADIYRRLVWQVWAGTAAGVVVCLVVGGAFIGVFYGLGQDIWSQSEDLWEGVFYLVATAIISVMGLALLRINRMRDKWRLKIAQALAARTVTATTTTTAPAAAAATESIGDAADNSDAEADASSTKSTSRLGNWSRRHVMFILPFITTMREGVEAVVFIGGVSLSLPVTAFPLPVVCGLSAALAVGYLLWRGSNAMSVQYFLIGSTSLLYLIAAGMFSKAVWLLQYHAFARRVGGDVAEAGSGPGSYDISQTVWHVNCCNPETDAGWDVFNAILGWQNTATYGSVISYCAYWIALIFAVACLLYEERTGSLPLQGPFVSAVSRVPGLRRLVASRRDAVVIDADEVIGQVRPSHLVDSAGN